MCNFILRHYDKLSYYKKHANLTKKNGKINCR